MKGKQVCWGMKSPPISRADTLQESRKESYGYSFNLPLEHFEKREIESRVSRSLGGIRDKIAARISEQLTKQPTKEI